MTIVTVDDVLAHYGTKGMKWGVRKRNSFSNGNGVEKKIRYKSLVVAGVVASAAILATSGATRYRDLKMSERAEMDLGGLYD